MAKPWTPYACQVPGKGITGTCSVMDVVHHVTHTPAALRIIEDQKITRGLIYDKCSLNDSRTTVVWLSPNQWVNGSRYGNVEFTFDFKSLAKGQKIYWVEAHTGYTPHACRFLVTDESVSHLPVQLYDPVKDEGPLRHVDGVWYWNWKFTGEFLLQNILWLHDCKKLDFIKHHDTFCALGGCSDRGKYGERAAGRVIAQILAQSNSAVDEPLIVTDPKRALSSAVDMGLSRICIALKANSGKLNGPLDADASVDAVLRAGLLQYASGDVSHAVETIGLIKSDAVFLKRLAKMVEQHFGLKSELLES